MWAEVPPCCADVNLGTNEPRVEAPLRAMDLGPRHECSVGPQNEIRHAVSGTPETVSAKPHMNLLAAAPGNLGAQGALPNPFGACSDPGRASLISRALGEAKRAKPLRGRRKPTKGLDIGTWGRPGSLMHDCPRHSRDDGLGGNNPQNRLFRAARSEKQSPREIVPPRKFRDTDSGAPKNRLFWTKQICFQLLKSVKGDCSASRDCFLNLAEIVKFPVKFVRLFPPGEMIVWD